MDTKLLSAKFEQIGARVQLRPVSDNIYRRELAGIDIGADHKGEYVDIRLANNDQVDPRVYVRGRVWHPDHKTIVLDDWHRVLMNTEREASGASHVVFLD